MSTLPALGDSNIKIVYCSRIGCAVFTAGRKTLTENDNCKAQRHFADGDPAKLAIYWDLLSWLRIKQDDLAIGPSVVSAIKEARKTATAGPPTNLAIGLTVKYFVLSLVKTTFRQTRIFPRACQPTVCRMKAARFRRFVEHCNYTSRTFQLNSTSCLPTHPGSHSWTWPRGGSGIQIASHLWGAERSGYKDERRLRGRLRRASRGAGVFRTVHDRNACGGRAP